MNESTTSLRVLQVLEATLGGTRRYLEDVFEAMGEGPENGLVYSLHRADDGFRRLLEKLRAARWALFEVDMRRSITPVSDLSSVLALRSIYRSFRPVVVHAHSSKAGAIARLATLGMRRRPGIAYSPHSIGVHLGAIYRPIEHLLALRLDVLSAVTPSEREELRALRLLPAGQIHVVVPTIRAEEYSPRDRQEARGRLGLGDAPLVVAAGRLTAQKDPLTFVEFTRELRARVRDVRALWVGDGELRPAMEARIRDAGLDGALSITGWVQDVRTHLAAADLVVSTSSYESFGYVMAEALAMNRPVVASAITGTVDVVTTDVGEQLYPHRDVAAAAVLAERFLRDRDHALEVASRGRTRILSAFSKQEMRSGLSRVYAAAAR